jgi:hypothetical protein
MLVDAGCLLAGWLAGWLACWLACWLASGQRCSFLLRPCGCKDLLLSVLHTLQMSNASTETGKEWNARKNQSLSLRVNRSQFSQCLNQYSNPAHTIRSQPRPDPRGCGVVASSRPIVLEVCCAACVVGCCSCSGRLALALRCTPVFLLQPPVQPAILILLCLLIPGPGTTLLLPKCKPLDQIKILQRCWLLGAPVGWSSALVSTALI